MSSHDHAFSDVTKLVDGRGTAEKGVIPHMHMAGEKDRVRQYHLFTENAIMPDVASRHQKGARAYPRHSALHTRPANRHQFADPRARPDNYPGGHGRIKSQILRFAAQHRAGMNLNACLENRSPAQDRMRSDPAIGTESDAVFNN